MRDNAARGRTEAGRLRLVDAFVAGLYAEEVDRIEDFLALDIGFGESPETSFELEAMLCELGFDAYVIATDITEHRVRVAKKSYPESSVDFRLASFADALKAGERPQLIRAMNVLRGYNVEEIDSIHDNLLASLRQGGFLFEGSASPDGKVVVAHVFQQDGPRQLVFLTDKEEGAHPLIFRDYLPRDLRRSFLPGGELHHCFDTWKRGWETQQGSSIHRLRESFRSLGLVQELKKGQAFLLER